MQYYFNTQRQRIKKLNAKKTQKMPFKCFIEVVIVVPTHPFVVVRLVVLRSSLPPSD